MAKKKSSALFEAMSRSKGLKPMGVPRPGVLNQGVKPTEAAAGALPGGDPPPRRFEAPKWFQRKTTGNASYSPVTAQKSPTTASTQVPKAVSTLLPVPATSSVPPSGTSPVRPSGTHSVPASGITSVPASGVTSVPASSDTSVPASGTHSVPTAGPTQTSSVKSSAPMPSSTVSSASAASLRSPEPYSVGAPGGGSALGPAVENDSENQQLRVKLSYTALAIILFAVITTVALAALVGREWSNRHKAPAETTEELLAGQARPDVLNTRSGQADPGRAAGSGETSPPPVPVPGGGSGSTTPPSGNGTGAAPPTPLPTGGNPQSGNLPGGTPGGTSVGPSGRVSRVVGLNYLVVQSYPEEEDAKESVALLAKSGIPATIEKGLVGFPKWHIVVVAQGFPRGAKETEELRRRVDQISADQRRRDKKWKLWEPLAYRWR